MENTMISNGMLWNEKDLPNPPINSYKPTNLTFDIQKLRHAVQEGFDHFKNNKLLKMETAILQRILYRLSTKFRTGKDFKMMKKLGHCLDIYYSTNISRHFVDILHLIPKNNINNPYLPTKNMLVYILVRLQGLSKLMQRMYECCHIVAVQLNQRLYIGHFWKMLILFFALVSRITALVRHNTRFICHIYGKLLPYASKLENNGKNWLPEDYVLPTDLRIWLDVDWVYEDDFVDLTYEPSNDVINIFDLVKDDEDDDILFCDEYILLDDEEKQIERDFKNLQPLKDTLKRTREFSITEEDIDDIIDLSENTSNMEVLEEVEELDEKIVSSNQTLLKYSESTLIVDQELSNSYNEKFNTNGDPDDVGEEIVNLGDSCLGSNLLSKKTNTNKKKKEKLKTLFVDVSTKKKPVKRKITACVERGKEGNKKRKTEANSTIMFAEKVKETNKMKKRDQKSTSTSYVVDQENNSPVKISDSESSVIILENKDSAGNPIGNKHNRKASFSDSDDIVFVSSNSNKTKKKKNIKRNPSLVNGKNKKKLKIKQPKHRNDNFTKIKQENRNQKSRMVR